MGDAIKTLLTSKRSLIGVLTAIFNCALAILAAVGYSHDPEQAAAVWNPVIAAVALMVSLVATSVIKSYGSRDPGQMPGSGASAILLVLLVGMPGCMRALQEPATNHAVEANEVAERCRAKVGGYSEAPCSEDLQRSLDGLARSADAIEAIAQGKEPAE